MEPWRELAIKLFPELASIYADEEETVWQVLFDLHDEVVRAHEANDVERLRKIYEFAEWCHSWSRSEDDLERANWVAAYAAFYEHLGEQSATYNAIPHWVTPAVFKDILGELEDRLDNKEKYPFESPGTFRQLLEMYDSVNRTDFAAEYKTTGK